MASMKHRSQLSPCSSRLRPTSGCTTAPPDDCWSVAQARSARASSGGLISIIAFSVKVTRYNSPGRVYSYLIMAYDVGKGDDVGRSIVFLVGWIGRGLGEGEAPTSAQLPSLHSG